MVFLAFGVEPMDKDNVKVWAVGRDERFEVFHPAFIERTPRDVYIERSNALERRTSMEFMMDFERKADETFGLRWTKRLSLKMEAVTG